MGIIPINKIMTVLLEELKTQGIRLTDEEVAGIQFIPMEATNEILGVFNWGDTEEEDEMSMINLLYSSDDPEERDILLYIPVHEYMRVVYNWIKGKQQYCDLYGYPCGVFGAVSVEDYEIKGNVEYYNRDTDKTEYIPSVIVFSFSDVPDFEHG